MKKRIYFLRPSRSQSILIKKKEKKKNELKKWKDKGRWK